MKTYSKCIVSYKGDILVKQVYEKNGKFWYREFDSPQGITVKETVISEEEFKKFTEPFKVNSLTSENGRVLLTSERLENNYEKKYEFPKYEPDDWVELLNATQTYFKKVVGYCALHKRYLSTTQLKNKQCLNKQCYRLLRLPHNYWVNRELVWVSKKLKQVGIQI